MGSESQDLKAVSNSWTRLSSKPLGVLAGGVAVPSD
jgi:hypothetical protein